MSAEPNDEKPAVLGMTIERPAVAAKLRQQIIDVHYV
jgi:hypothetical protein